MTHHAEMTVLGGLPVTIAYQTARAEPDVGYAGGVDDWWVEEVAGRSGNHHWVHRRIDATEGEHARIIEELNDHATWN